MLRVFFYKTDQCAPFKFNSYSSNRCRRYVGDIWLNVEGPPDEDGLLVLLQQVDASHKHSVQHEKGKYLQKMGKMY